MQLDDYLGLKTTKIFEMWVPKIYQRVWKHYSWFPFKRHSKRAKPSLPTPKSQTRLDHLVFPKSYLKISQFKYFNRFPSIPQTIFDDYARGIIPKKEWICSKVSQNLRDILITYLK